MGERTTKSVSATRLPSFDGLRALAVVAVLLFHAEITQVRGGFLGVSAFFTLSGFLITTVLMSEQRNTGRIRLSRFWAGRARRLLPAAMVALAGVLAFGAFVATGQQVRNLRGDAFSALTYTANWHFVVSGRSYSEIFSQPSPLLHFWSLAIEEQFYVVFPLVLIAALKFFRGRVWLVAAFIGVLTVGSVAMSSAYARDIDRAYYGTDSRAAELLIGALLALLVMHWNGPRTVTGRRALGCAGIGALGLLCYWWATVDRTDAWLYHGGLALHAVITAVVICAACAPTMVASVLAIGPLAALGRISYGVYLYHWPIFLWLSPERVGLSTMPLLALRLAVTVACAFVSFHVLEEPIRTRRSPLGAWPRVLTPATASLLVVGIVAVTATPPRAAFTLEPLGDATARRRATPAAAMRSIANSVRSTVPTTTALAAASTPAEPPVLTFRRASAEPRAVRMLVVGDSVGITLGRGLELWSRANGRVVVDNVARKWCSLGRNLPRIAGLGASVPSAGCDDWATRWTREIDRFDPDVVVVLYTVWELIPRQLPGSDFSDPGDQAHDAWQLSEYQAAADVLGRRGADVVWLTIPCTPDAGSGRGTTTNTVNDKIIRGVQRAREFVRVLDLDAQLCPRHQYRSDYGAVDPARPDGRHFSDDGAREVANWMIPIVLGDAPPPQSSTARIMTLR
jgi:peptidoglycan/LPS O-acetylase OafA/YrhL